MARIEFDALSLSEQVGAGDLQGDDSFRYQQPSGISQSAKLQNKGKTIVRVATCSDDFQIII